MILQHLSPISIVEMDHFFRYLYLVAQIPHANTDLVRVIACYLSIRMANLQTLSPDEVAKLPLSVLNTLPALLPPVGVKSNFINPEDIGYVHVSVATVLFCLMVCFFATRVYTKLFIIRKMGWDDCECAFR